MRSTTHATVVSSGARTLEPYLRAIDDKPTLGAKAEHEQATKIRDLRHGYWSALVAVPEAPPMIRRAMRDTLGPKGKGAPRLSRTGDNAAFIEALVDLDLTCDVADRVLADLESSTPPTSAAVLRVQRRRLALTTARKNFAAANLRLVLTMAGRYRRTGFLPFADLVQEGNVGLMMAVDRFDPRRGFRFSTYAAWWIRHAITRALSNRGRSVRLPTHVIELRSKVQQYKELFEGEHQRQPTNAEVAEGVGVPEAKIERLGRVMMQQEVLSRGGTKPSGAVDPLDALAGVPDDPAERIDASFAAVVLRQGLEELPEIEREIIELRFGLEGGDSSTLREIGQRFSLSRERIRQLQVRAIERLRAQLDARGVQFPFAAEA